MPEIRFLVEGIAPHPQALSPTLAVNLRVINGTPEPVHSMLVRCQAQIEPARRRYTPEEQAKLRALFAEPARWGETLRPFLWQHAICLIGGFTGTTVAEMLLPCSYDFALAATQYFDALTGGDAPIRLLFSGTVFHQTDGGVQATPIPWEIEAGYRMPAAAWRTCVEALHPNCGWLRLRRDVFHRLLERRTAGGHGSWEETIEALLRASRVKREAA